MSAFVCGRCDHLKHTDHDLFHYVKEIGSVEWMELCDDCFHVVLDEHERGDRILAEIDGEDARDFTG